MQLRKIALILCTLLMMADDTKAQLKERILNMAEHDNKPYYFGLTFGLNFASYRVRYTDSYAQTDTFKSIQPRFSPGFNLGLMGNLRLSSFIDLRFVPSLSFADKRLDIAYGRTSGEDSAIQRNVESIYMHLPLQLKFKSDRINNFRFYGMAGYKFDIDLAANARSRRRDEFLKVKPIDMGYELGVGFEFYYPNFIFSPEIKLSQGLMNQQFKDPDIPLSNAIDEINTRMIVISVHLQG